MTNLRIEGIGPNLRNSRIQELRVTAESLNPSVPSIAMQVLGILFLLGTEVHQIFPKALNLLPALGGKVIYFAELILTDVLVIQSTIELGLNLRHTKPSAMLSISDPAALQI